MRRDPQQREVIFVQALVVKSARRPNWIERALGHAGNKEWKVSSAKPATKWWPLHAWADQLAPARGRADATARRNDRWVNWTFGGALVLFAAALLLYWK